MSDNYDPATPLKADATDEQIVARGVELSPLSLSHRASGWMVLAREFAEARGAFITEQFKRACDERDIVRELSRVLLEELEQKEAELLSRAALGRSPSAPPTPDADVRYALKYHRETAAPLDLTRDKTVCASCQ